MFTLLRPIFSVLLALVVCGVSSQAAVCAISCGLGAHGTVCRMPAGAQQAAMKGMSHEHCSTGPAPRVAFGTDRYVTSSSLGGAGCAHSLWPAIEVSITSNVGLAVAQWPLLHTAWFKGFALCRVDVAHGRPPPLSASGNPLLITLRI